MAKSEGKSARRSSRREQRQREEAQKKRRQALVVGGPFAAVVLVVVGLLLYRAFEPEIEGVVDYGVQGRDHDSSVVFPTSGLPPVGGTHRPTWQNCGIYDTPVDSALAVHSLEHGAVWISYEPALPAGDVATLEDMARGNPRVLLAPYPGLSSPVVLSAWGKQLELDGLPDGRIDRFIRRYQGQGPEPGASCAGGVGVPSG